MQSSDDAQPTEDAKAAETVLKKDFVLQRVDRTN